ncbi:MAG: NAD(+)/NADH kinase, partial [Phycisphaerae bacterium]|nr:NAD(+)/NADH kinase [Phycisphaerae bacterium]
VDPPCRRHLMLAATVRGPDGGERGGGIAMNDCVITAGPPFRMIEGRMTIDGEPGPILTGDGMIVATPVGSTAYSISAGGPIVHPGVEAIVITPLAAHSLAFRPIVLGAECVLEFEVLRANEGTTLIHDGQVATTVRTGDRIHICRDRRTASFVANPDMSYWRTIQDKLHWAAAPKYRATAEATPPGVDAT